MEESTNIQWVNIMNNIAYVTVVKALVELLLNLSIGYIRFAAIAFLSLYSVDETVWKFRKSFVVYLLARLRLIMTSREHKPRDLLERDFLLTIVRSSVSSIETCRSSGPEFEPYCICKFLHS